MISTEINKVVLRKECVKTGAISRHIEEKSDMQIEAGKQYYIIQKIQDMNCVLVDIGTLHHIIPIVGVQDAFSKNTDRASYYHFSVFCSQFLEKPIVIYSRAQIFQTIIDVKHYCFSNNVTPYYGYSICKI